MMDMSLWDWTVGAEDQVNGEDEVARMRMWQGCEVIGCWICWI